MVSTEAVIDDKAKPALEDPSTVKLYRPPFWCSKCDVGQSYERCWWCGDLLERTEGELYRRRMASSGNTNTAMAWAPEDCEPDE